MRLNGAVMRVFAILYALTTTFLGTACDNLVGVPGEIIESRYETYDEASRGDGASRGWLPTFLPMSAREIREIHNLDSAEVWLSFEFQEQDRAQLARSCRAVSVTEVCIPRTPPNVTWWPKTLASESGNGGNFDAIAFYSCHRNDGLQSYLAVDGVAPRAWYWVLRGGGDGSCPHE